jgi:osmotically-inducible protein OsmY
MRRSAASLSVRATTCATGLLVFTATHNAWSAPPLTDTTISDAVEDELLVDKAVPLQKIDVTTIDGIVTLEGQVRNALAKERAANIAETVKGVCAVVKFGDLENSL